MIKNIEFSKINNSFQEKLSNDISLKKKKKKRDKVFVSANKSQHVY